MPTSKTIGVWAEKGGKHTLPTVGYVRYGWRTKPNGERVYDLMDGYIAGEEMTPTMRTLHAVAAEATEALRREVERELARRGDEVNS